jgi:hypothetical protein
MIIDGVYEIKRGIIIEVKNAIFVPEIGEIYSCGIDSWKIIGIEKLRTGCFGKNTTYDNSYLLLVIPINNSKKPLRGYLLDKVIL